MSMFEEISAHRRLCRACFRRIARVAPADSTVLIMGDTGTGKELVARAIHKRSQRPSGVRFRNCAAVPPSLIARNCLVMKKERSRERSSDASVAFELAEGGTIFLDEIGELPAETQIALLRVLQEREFERVGGNHPIPTDVRVIAATNRNLQAALVAARSGWTILSLSVSRLKCLLCASVRRTSDALEHFVKRYGQQGRKKHKKRR